MRLSRDLLATILTTFFACCATNAAERPWVALGKDGRLVYDADERGNRVPDFSHCGYMSGANISDVPTRERVPAANGDATVRIQAAIDRVAALPLDADGFRGAVVLEAGRHEVAGAIRLSASGVVLRGQDATLVATGTDRRTLIQVVGRDDRTPGASWAVADEYVPVGATKLRLRSPGPNVGDTVAVEHPGAAKWIAALGMNQFGGKEGGWLGWRPNALNVRFERIVIARDGDAVTLDVPLTLALDASLTQCRVVAQTWPGRVRRVGVENLRCESTFDAGNPRDEQHAWNCVAIENAADVWVRGVSATHFAGSAVMVGEGGRNVTVEDCRSLDPVSELGGYRRHTFFVAGQQVLVRRCKAERGRHDFAVGFGAAGPNAFVECEAVDASNYSGPVESWASGVLYDNVTVDGGGLSLTNREIAGQGVGWAAANCVLWQCVAPVVTVRQPPTAQNWAFGSWGQFVGDGQFRSCNSFVKPQSLYAAQFAERAVTPRRAAGREPASAPLRVAASQTLSHLTLTHGRLTVNDKLLTGTRVGVQWWRGSLVPGRLSEFGPGITRFVPGRDGAGLTDDLDELTDRMKATGIVVLEHHWGLWYDRRRDDHQMVRRIDGEVWPPFYEQPWARSGTGTAWDGLSKYDLTKFNPWYFARLRRFAELCERKGLVLVHQMYFQHNILEAGAHWADCPWRPANCIQATGFPEPPPYAGGKRVFMAEAFYDVTHPVRRELHRAYIRHCLDALAGCANVVHLTGAEFNGPRHFAEFWLDTVREWRAETGRAALIGLSCTKDVQDAILDDPARSPAVDVIDVRQWWYTENGTLYAPAGGQNLAPRQQQREWKGPSKSSPAQTARAVAEYRRRFPAKAVIASHDGANGWAALAAGGSLPAVRDTDAALLAAAARMAPLSLATEPNQWALAEPGRGYLVYSATAANVRLDLTKDDKTFVVHRLDARTGRPQASDSRAVSGGATADVAAPADGPWVLWLTRE